MYIPANRSKATNFRKSAYAPKTKRWYVDASIPKGVPFIGGTSLKAGSGTLSRRSLIAQVKNSLTEKKTKIVSTSTTGYVHNTCYTHAPLANIPIGTGPNSRLGQVIQNVNLNYKMMLGNLNAAVATQATPIFVRVFVVKSRAQYQSGSDTFGSGIGSTDLFESGTTYFNIAALDTNKVVILYDKIIKLAPTNTLVTKSNDVQILDINLDLGKMDYLTPTSNYGKNNNPYICLIPYVVGGTTGVTVCGEIQCEGEVTFHDG